MKNLTYKGKKISERGLLDMIDKSKRKNKKSIL